MQQHVMILLSKQLASGRHLELQVHLHQPVDQNGAHLVVDVRLCGSSSNLGSCLPNQSLPLRHFMEIECRLTQGPAHKLRTPKEACVGTCTDYTTAERH